MFGRIDTRFRLLGLLPLIFFLVQAIHYWRYGGLGHLLWMCNVGNVLLGIGLLLGHRELVRAAAIWTIPGLGIWIYYVLMASGFYFSTTLAHVGGIIVGLIALRRVGMDRLAWVWAFAWHLVMQVVTRLVAPPELNVNVVDRIQPGWDRVFGSYWMFLLVGSAVLALCLWAIGKLFYFIWPAESAVEPEQVAIESGSSHVL